MRRVCHGRVLLCSTVLRSARHAVSTVPTSSTVVPTACVTSGHTTTDPSFDSIPQWCALCCEPMSSWTEHVGKREHIALAMVFDAVVAAPRQWNPEEVWQEAAQCFGPRCASPSRRRASVGVASTPGLRFRERHHLPSHAVVPCGDASPWHDMLHWYDQHDTARGRREAIHNCLCYWAARGALDPLLVPAYFSSAAFHGTMVLFKDLFPPLAKVFPLAAAKDISAMTQMMSTAFHLETLFDLCEMAPLLPQGMAATRQAHTLSAPTRLQRTHSMPAGSEHDSGAVDDATTRSIAASAGAALSDDGTMTLKANFVRAVLGLMRWAVEPDSLQTKFELPYPRHAPDGGGRAGSADTFPPWVPLPSAGPAVSSRWSAAACSTDAILASHTAQLMVSELITLRLGEYVSRVEPVVRETEARHGAGGLAKMRANLRATRLSTSARKGALRAHPPLSPLPYHAGSVVYLQNDVVSALNPFMR